MLTYLYFIVLIFALSFLYASWKAAPFLPMFTADLDRVASIVNINKDELFIDLGCGEGKTLIMAAKKGARACGYEISLLPYIWAKINIFFSGLVNKPKVIFRDFWKINLGDADVVFIFLMPAIMNKLKEKFEKELKPGTRVVCYTFGIPDWNPVAVDETPGRPKIYLYKR